MKQLQFRIFRYVFHPTLVGTLITLICIPLFIKLGVWQYSKAEQKQVIHAAYDKAKVDEALNFPLGLIHHQGLNVDEWKYRKVTVKGVYETKYQFLLDNQVEGGRVGYHVITPLKIEQTNEYVLINRGWILGNDTHAELPEIETPIGQQNITGLVWVPSKKIFTLEKTESSSENTADVKVWPLVWQNMNMEKFRHNVPFSVSELAVKLDQHSHAGGFVRNWQIPAERITTNIGYAYQWFGFAFATMLIYLYMSISKVRTESH